MKNLTIGIDYLKKTLRPSAKKIFFAFSITVLTPALTISGVIGADHLLMIQTIMMSSLLYIFSSISYWIRMSFKVVDEHKINLFGIIAVLILFIVCFFVLNFSYARGYVISDDIAQWGQMGDFFGGMLNPILAFASFIAVLHTIKLQSTAMENARIDLKEQQSYERLMADTRMIASSATELIEQGRSIQNKQIVVKSLKPRSRHIFKNRYRNSLCSCGIDPSVENNQANNSFTLNKMLFTAITNFYPTEKKGKDADAFLKAKIAIETTYTTDEFDFGLVPAAKECLLKSLELEKSLKTYIELCARIGVDVDNDPVSYLILVKSTSNLAEAYIIANVTGLSTTGLAPSLFVPEHSHSLELFKSRLTDLGLPSECVNSI